LRKENEPPTFDHRVKQEFKSFTGGSYGTNCFLLEAPGGGILFDAPEGADERFAGENIGLLVLTHGHWDHTTDAAAVRRRHACAVACHAETVPMLTEADFFERAGFPLRIETLPADRLLAAGPGQDFLGRTLDVLEVPGHCPGSLCFHDPRGGVLVGGDVLFRGGVGRWDLPGGDRELLLNGIRRKIYSLPEDTVVLPGHGPATTVGNEKASNPFVQA
jgi:hydroxyacylglutathione hydrolase